MVYDFDVICPQETRTCPYWPLALQDFTIIQRHQDCGMAIVVCSDLSETVSSYNLHKCCTSSRELQGIRIEKPDETKPLILINAYMHPSTCTTGASWDFLEETENEWEAQPWYAAISVHDQVCGIDMAPTSRDVHKRKHSAMFFHSCFKTNSHTPLCLKGWHRQHNWPGTCVPKSGTMDACRNSCITWDWPPARSLQSTEIREWTKKSQYPFKEWKIRHVCDVKATNLYVTQQNHNRKPSKHPGGTRKPS